MADRRLLKHRRDLKCERYKLILTANRSLENPLKNHNLQAIKIIH